MLLEIHDGDITLQVSGIEGGRCSNWPFTCWVCRRPMRDKPDDVPFLFGSKLRAFPNMSAHSSCVIGSGADQAIRLHRDWTDYVRLRNVFWQYSGWNYPSI